MPHRGSDSAIVTGASSGIGRATALRLARAGYAVALVDKDGSGLEVTAAELEGISCMLEADLSQVGVADEVVAGAAERLGDCSVLVNAAGILRRSSFLRHSLEDWQQTLAINLDAPFFLSAAFVRSLIDRRLPGVIVNVASIESTYPLPGHAAYSASKGALLMLTKAMAVDLAPWGIRVIAVCPGVIETSMNAELRSDPSRREPLREQIPLGRFGEASEVAEAIAFLASDKASYITGAALLVDGGWAAH